jgi:hypothetical protein
MPQLRPFQASADNVKNTTEELHSVTAPYAISNKAAQLRLAPNSSREAPLDIVIRYAEEGAKGSKRRCKQHR